MQLPIVDNIWTKDKIELQIEDGTIIRLTKCNDYALGEIDKSHTHENQYKKWNTFGGFNENSPYLERIKSENNLKDALWEFHFSYLGKENEKLDLNQKLHSVSMAQMNLYHWLTEDMELPSPKEIQDIDNLFLIEGGEVFIKANPSQRDLTQLGTDKLGFQNKLMNMYHTYDKEFKERLIITCPTQSKDGTPTLGEFINWYKDILFKAYTRWDFRLLYQPYSLTGKYGCPFKGRTPNVQEIVAKIS